MSPKRLRGDIETWRRLLSDRKVDRTWHFCPLCCVPSLLYRGRLLSIERLEQMGLVVPTRPSREQDIHAGVGNVVKLARYPYWKMLSTLMRQGAPEVMLELSTEPILWEDTYFGSSNVWEGCWRTGNDLAFASEKVFVSPTKWDGKSPPEIYVPVEVPLEGVLLRIHTVLEEEREELDQCLNRLGISEGVELFTSGFSSPFPNNCREDYIRNQPQKFDQVRRYLRRVSPESLSGGVEIE